MRFLIDIWKNKSFERLAGRKNETSSQEDFEDMRVN